MLKKKESNGLIKLLIIYNYLVQEIRKSLGTLMEDYQSAFFQRYQDTEALQNSNRKIAAMHFGGVTIECLLKQIIFDNLPRGTTKEWKTDSNNPGHTFTNPGHDLQEALKRCNRLNSRVQKFSHVIKWINKVECPSQHFIDMRYTGTEPDNDSYKEWLIAYQHLRQWLQKQATQL